MGNQHSASHASLKPRKNVHWKSAGRPAAPGKPDIIPILTDDEPNAITLKWTPAAHDGGAPLQGYQVECNRLGSADWIRTAPPVVVRPELVLSGLEPPHRYQFRVAALNGVGRSEYSELSDVLTVSFERGAQEAPIFLEHLNDITALENDKTEFRVTFTGAPTPTIAWFKDDYEIFSSRRTAITTTESNSVLVFHQTLASDEGEIKCTATNRVGHAVTKARLALEAAPKLRYPRQYEDGLLYEINETVYLKTTIVGKPTPTIEWRHDGQPIVVDERVEISNSPKFSVLKIHSARRSDRGEYQIHARNNIGEDIAAFLVTITAPPDPPRRVSVTRQVDKSVTLDWEPPEDDGGCRIGNYVVEYYRSGWNVWLKATTSRKTNVTLFDLIEGSEYRFRVKAESPYGMSAPSVESAPVKIPGRAVDMEFLAVESRIINEVLTREEGEEPRVSPAPRRKRAQTTAPEAAPPARMMRTSPAKDKDPTGSSEFMLVLYPDSKSDDKTEKRKSFQLDLEDALSPPPISLSAPELSSRCIMPFKALRNAVSSTELLHERAMARFYKAVAMKEEQTKQTKEDKPKTDHNADIPYDNSRDIINNDNETFTSPSEPIQAKLVMPNIIIKSDSVEDREYEYNSRQASQDSETSENRWHQNISFDEDYTASTVSTDGDYSDDGSLDGDLDRRSQYSNEEDTYNPRNKVSRPSSHDDLMEEEEEESEREILKPLPLPDPNFVPKPILKRRDLDIPETKPVPNLTSQNSNEKPKLGEINIKEDKQKKDDKMKIFKRITKMPVQKPFQFPKLLSKKEPQKLPQDNLPNDTNKKINKIEKVQDKISEEGRTVIDYYTNIVKEYGGQKKPVTPLYLNTEDLKNVAEKQQYVDETRTKERKTVKPKKTIANKTNDIKTPVNKNKTANSITKPKPKQVPNMEKPKLIKKEKLTTRNSIDKQNNSEETQNRKCTQQIVLKKTERATIVIPIDYQELEEKAKVTVRSAIDYMVDMCLLLLAFWVYFFKDERLAIPFLILIIYRQLQETLLSNIPEWVKRHTPSWIKKKTS
ncbi:titin [Achroia grisella]|uniref:titin n=1 Tax=Achroia grisella TaxID=688607 RepID=UPI0027D34E49|nr:titin [Achroia grisella]